MFAKIKNAKGFTLIEVMMVMIILGILVQMALTFALDIRTRSYDAVALADGKNLMTVVGTSFIGLDDVDFTHTSADGSDIGGYQSDTTTVRSPVFTLSSGVKAVISGTSPGVPGGGSVEASLYHENGTYDNCAYCVNDKRTFWFTIDEISATISSPAL